MSKLGETLDPLELARTLAVAMAARCGAELPDVESVRFLQITKEELDEAGEGDAPISFLTVELRCGCLHSIDTCGGVEPKKCRKHSPIPQLRPVPPVVVESLPF